MLQPARPKGVPRAEWNAASARARRRIASIASDVQPRNNSTNRARRHAGAPAHSNPTRDPRWHFGVSSPWGSLSAGSSDKSNLRRRNNPASRDSTFTTTPGNGNRKRELVSTVLSSQSFSSTMYRIQPADTTIFPWVGSIAAKYQKWRCVFLALEYVPTVTDFANAGKQGRVVLAANYDSLDANLENITQAETISPNSPGMPDEYICLTLNPKQVTPVQRLVRPGQVPAGGTITSFDGGVFYVAVNGIDTGVTDGTQLGELFVNYEFEFYDPIIPGLTVTPQPTHSSQVLGQYDVTLTIPNNVWTAMPDVVSGPAPNGWNGLGLIIDGTLGTVTFPPGRYRISGSGQVNSSAAVTLFSTRFANAAGTATIAGSHHATACLAAAGVTSFPVTFDWTVHFTVTTLTIPQIKITGAGVHTPEVSEWPQFTVVSIG